MRLTVIALFVAVLSGCALRPRYADFVTPKTEGKEVTFLVTDSDTRQPVPNARVEVSELRNRLQVTTGPDGTFKLPVEKKYLEENPIFVVTLPQGIVHYQVSLAPPPAAPVPVPVPVQEVVPPVEAAPDAGTPASNG